MPRTPSDGRVRSFLRRHERRLAVLWVAGVLLTMVGVAIPRVRAAVMDRAEAAVVRWDDRWSDRLEAGERMVAEARYEEAAAYLEQVDADFPARSVHFARDRERERVLHALGQSYEALDRKGRALETYRRAVAFDPLNYENHLALANAARRFEEPEEAAEHFRHILAIHPTHLPSLGAIVALEFEAGRFGNVMDRFERYLDAFVIQSVPVTLDSVTTMVRVRADGRRRRVRVLVPHVRSLGTPRAPELVVDLGSTEGRLERVELVGAAVAGRLGIERAVWTETVRGSGELTPGLGSLAFPIMAIELELTLLRPVDTATWALVETSYRNTLAFDALATARERSAIGPAAAAAADGKAP